MNKATVLAREGHRLLQIGIGLLLFSSLEGFFIPSLSSPRLALSVHTLAALQAVLFLGLGAMWSRLRFTVATARIAFWLLAYSTFAILAAYLLAAIWGAGNGTMPLAAGSAHGSAFQEAVIKAVAYSSAPTGLASFALILWGLRLRAVEHLG